MTVDISIHEFTSLREDISELRTTMGKIADALERLARLEEKHSNSARAIERAFMDIAKVDIKCGTLDTRVAALEVAQPANRRTSEWLERAAYGCLCIIVLVLLKKAGLV